MADRHILGKLLAQRLRVGTRDVLVRAGRGHRGGVEEAAVLGQRAAGGGQPLLVTVVAGVLGFQLTPREAELAQRVVVVVVHTVVVIVVVVVVVVQRRLFSEPHCVTVTEGAAERAVTRGGRAQRAV